jgi:cell shape-determining protein MreD
VKRALYAGLVFGLVPFQSTILSYGSLGGVRPDLCLVATCLVGFLAGEMEGMMLGLALGFVQDLFSASDLCLNLVTKAMIGLLAGVAARHLASATPLAVLGTILAVSALSGVIFLAAVRGAGGPAEMGMAFLTIVLPQALFDAGIGAGVYWLIAGRARMQPTTEVRTVPFAG